MNDPHVILPTFNPVVDLPEHFLMLMYGVRRSGKTVLMKYLLKEMEERLKYTEVYVICASLEVNPDQYDFIPKSAQFSDVENLDFRLRTIMDDQKEKMRQQRDAEKDSKNKPKKKQKFDSDTESSDGEGVTRMKHESLSRKAAKKEINDPESYKDAIAKPILIILDDVVNENAVRTSPYLRLLAIGGRHIMISCIILSQVVAGSASVPPAVRTQADTIVVVAQPRSRIERDLIAEQYLCATNESNAKQVGLQLMNKATEVQHRALVISTVSPSARSYPDYCFIVGPAPFPPTPEDFRLGTEEQWNFEMRKKKPKSKHMPNPLAHTLELPKDKRTGEYLRGLEEDIFW